MCTAYLRGKRNFAKDIIRCTDCGLQLYELSSSDYVRDIGHLKDSWEELQRLIVKYEITLGSRRNERVLIDHVDPNSILEIRNNHKMTEADYDILKKEKPNILAILHEEAERRKQEADERQAKIDAIEGVSELETAIADFNKACKDYETKIEWYIYDGRCSKDFQPEKYPSASKVLALRKKYPKAVAYLKAKKWSETNCWTPAPETCLNDPALAED